MEKIVIAAKRALGLRIPAVKTDECAAPTPASLQGLPFELKVAVLKSLPGILALKSLVLASKEYFIVYHQAQNLILSSILQAELRPAVLCEAISVRKARDFPPKDKESVVRFLNDYKIGRSSQPGIEALDLASLVSMSKMQYLVETAAERYSASIITTNPRTGQPDDFPGPLSKNEKRRLYRAFYRLELFCLVFTRFNRHNKQIQGLPLNEADQLSYYANRMARIFLGLFSPWQVEEMTCIRNWMIEYYARALTRRKEEIDALHHKHCGSELEPWSPIQYRRMGYESDFRSHPLFQHKRNDEAAERLLSLGLNFFHKATRKFHIDPNVKIDLHPDLGVKQGFLTDTLYEYRDQQHYSRTLQTRFASDESGPSAGWDWCRAIRENRAHHHWHVEELRGIGYVMWDRERLLGWEILDMDPDDLASDLEERRQP